MQTLKYTYRNLKHINFPKPTRVGETSCRQPGENEDSGLTGVSAQPIAAHRLRFYQTSLLNKAQGVERTNPSSCTEQCSAAATDPVRATRHRAPAPAHAAARTRSYPAKRRSPRPGRAAAGHRPVTPAEGGNRGQVQGPERGRNLRGRGPEARA